MVITTAKCFFEGCNKPVEAHSWRCAFHKGRDRCSVVDCRRQAYARKLCTRHGGKTKCLVEGCMFQSRSMGLCAKHGVKRKPRLCCVPDCGKTAHSRRYCTRHGDGGRCNAPGCESYARRAGVCCRHSNPPRKRWEDDVKMDEISMVESFVELFNTEDLVDHHQERHYLEWKKSIHPVDLGILHVVNHM